MFGDKEAKRKRLAQVVALVARSESGIRQADLAAALDVSASTIGKDLANLHQMGTLLAEDDQGRLSVPDWNS